MLPKQKSPGMQTITGQYGATFSHKISPWSCMVLELYLVAKHNTSIYPGSGGEIGLGDYGQSVIRYLGINDRQT